MANPTELNVRAATADDLPAISSIYNYYVLHSTCTYQLEPETPEERRAWFAAHGPRHPVLVAEMDGGVVAWASLSRFHTRCAYAGTVENSLYVRHDLHGRGIGAALLAELIARARVLGHHTILASISADQPVSIALHHKFGFERVALLREVGCKLGRWLDVVYMQLML